MGVGATAAGATAAGLTGAAATSAVSAATMAGIATAGVGASVIGGGVMAVNAVQQGKDAKRMGERNAAISEQAALDKDRDARIIANAQRDRNKAIQARQRALYAKSGVNLGTGSPLLVQAQQAGELELAALEIERTASVQSSQLRQQAVLDRMAGRSAYRGGRLAAAGTILQTAGSAATSYARIKGIG
jgi:hypothetical protein